MPLVLMYITNNLNVALVAQKYGVDRIWIDLETVRKADRQRGLNTVKSRHSINDISSIKPQLTSSELLVRINSWHDASASEVDSVINAGADVVMLPYWKTVREVQLFLQAVSHRCKTTLLLETKEAVENLDQVLQLDGIDEIHIGLNDLHLSYGLSFMFELLSNGTIDSLCKRIGTAGIPFGFGGIARIGYGEVPAERLIMEHYRLGSSRAILSRSFYDANKAFSNETLDDYFCTEMRKIRDCEIEAKSLSEEKLLENHEVIKKLVHQIVKERSA